MNLGIHQERQVIYGEKTRPIKTRSMDARDQLDPTTAELHDKTLATWILPKQAGPAIRTYVQSTAVDRERQATASRLTSQWVLVPVGTSKWQMRTAQRRPSGPCLEQNHKQKSAFPDQAICTSGKRYETRQSRTVRVRRRPVEPIPGAAQQRTQGLDVGLGLYLRAVV